MEEIMREYGSAVLAAAGGALLFGMIGTLVLSDSGIVAQMISIWGNGGF